MARTCPHCGFQEETGRERCSSCGRSVLVAPPRLQGRRRRAVRWGAVAAAVVIVAILVPVVSRLQADRAARQRAADARAAATERARLRRVQAPRRGSAPDLRPARGAAAAQRLAARAALVRRVEAQITRDARARTRTGEIQGPIRSTSCGPFLRAPGAVPDDRVLSKAIGRYDCVAIKADIVKDGSSVGKLGYPFVAALDFTRFTFVWCRNTPPPSEAGQALGFVRLERACLAARGRPLGTGYVDVPGS